MVWRIVSTFSVDHGAGSLGATTLRIWPFAILRTLRGRTNPRVAGRGQSSVDGRIDRINTVGAQLSTLAAMAARAGGLERFFADMERSYHRPLNWHVGTHRGLFLVSTRERTQWAATLIAKMLPKGLLSRERVGFVFRAGGPLYESVAALGVRFRFFDQTLPWEETVRSICRFRPSILVAQPQVLRVLTDTPASLAPSPA